MCSSDLGELSNTIRLLDLPEDLREMIISGEISESHGRALLSLKNPRLMYDYAFQAFKEKWSVATLDSVIKTYLDSKKPRLEESAPSVEEEPIAEGDREENIETAEEAVEELKQLEREEAGEKQPLTGEAEKEGNKKKEIGSMPASPRKEPPTPAKKGVEAIKKEATAVKPKWERKLVIQEMKGKVIVSLGTKDWYQSTNFPGTIESANADIQEFVQRTTAANDKGGK